MNMPSIDYNAISYSQCIEGIQAFARRIDAPDNIMPMATALGIYIQKLQAEHSYAAVFPLELLPVPKNELRKWAYAYAAFTVKTTGKLARFQQDGALCFTRFQPMTKQQWETIRADTIPDLVRYHVEMRDKGTTTAQIPSDIKAIFDTYLAEYKTEEKTLHTMLRTSPSAKSGCAGRATAIVALFVGVAWWVVR